MKLYKRSFFVLAFAGCVEKEASVVPDVVFESVDTSSIPVLTVLQSDTALHLENGVYLLAGKPFSGTLREVYASGSTKSRGTYLEGPAARHYQNVFPQRKAGNREKL